MINDAHCIADALAIAGHHEAAFESEGIAAAMASEGGHNAVYDWAARGGFDLVATIGHVRQLVGRAADRLEACGRGVPSRTRRTPTGPSRQRRTRSEQNAALCLGSAHDWLNPARRCFRADFESVSCCGGLHR
jgi:hypothetical protein